LLEKVADRPGSDDEKFLLDTFSKKLWYVPNKINQAWIDGKIHNLLLMSQDIFADLLHQILRVFNPSDERRSDRFARPMRGLSVDYEGLRYQLSRNGQLASVERFVSGSNLTIAEKVRERDLPFPVVAVLPYACSDSPIQSISIGEWVDTLGAFAFSNCAHLDSVKIDMISHLRRIEQDCFADSSICRSF
jgi:hypothetical protein